MKHALALLLVCCALVAQNNPNTVDSNQKRAAELKRMLVEGKITKADLNRMFEEGKVSPAVMLMTNVEDDAAPAPQAKPTAAAPDPFAKIVGDFEAGEIRRQRLLQAPINVRDELIVEINTLKVQITKCRESLAINRSYLGKQAMNSSASNSYFDQAKVMHESNITLMVESQRALLSALVELSKLPAESPTVYHSASVLEGLNRKTKINVQVK